MVKLKIHKPYRIWIYSVFTLSWVSGVLFFILNWFQIETEFGVQKHPLQYLSIQFHGAGAFLMILTFGYLLGTHVKSTWNVKPRRKLGIMLLALPLILMITGYLLYYVVEDLARTIVIYIHLSLGITLPLILYFHIKKKRKKR